MKLGAILFAGLILNCVAWGSPFAGNALINGKLAECGIRLSSEYSYLIANRQITPVQLREAATYMADHCPKGRTGPQITVYLGALNVFSLLNPFADTSFSHVPYEPFTNLSVDYRNVQGALNYISGDLDLNIEAAQQNLRYIDQNIFRLRGNQFTNSPMSYVKQQTQSLIDSLTYMSESERDVLRYALAPYEIVLTGGGGAGTFMHMTTIFVPLNELPGFIGWVHREITGY